MHYDAEMCRYALSLLQRYISSSSLCTEVKRFVACHMLITMAAANKVWVNLLWKYVVVFNAILELCSTVARTYMRRNYVKGLFYQCTSLHALIKLL